MGYRATKRPLNVCRECGQTWYPRGANLSRRCPNCGSSNVRVSYAGCVSVIVFALFFWWLLGGDGDRAVSETATQRPQGARAIQVDAVCGTSAALRRVVDAHANWTEWRCQRQRQTSWWSECLAWSAYSARRSGACPGAQRCCPPTEARRAEGAGESAEDELPAEQPSMPTKHQLERDEQRRRIGEELDELLE